ncbi:hypothetical protein CJ179_46345 [Rhodococcus sp. ACS1]|uniref:hypothetical protein n=1 Tax=Rhodococcus sp. ACS1 TaxID=2028570 RepID=UPI000BDA502C|nr:hypothetical protein [Rhodococcus sp. ACS1]PBC35505.1 hypothetical protein CJ179_46345 [Rhodococcus sp. ACS1]
MGALCPAPSRWRPLSALQVVVGITDPQTIYRENARDLEEMLLRVRAEVENWPDARHGLRTEDASLTESDALAAVVAAQIRDARSVLAHVDGALQ